ncbi:hypothetical protein HTIA_1920 [Halorhabdus tiamatea SARL4B]|uniref:Uncharacterized protein n=1 Tax=Halorhabdus tiamatea SARL4B TaxID=1033806 RepID=F7PPK6_9EURY|nr:hypothetical protein HTIA_1920 [Halorhabdus tiamatea SARL4B]
MLSARSGPHVNNRRIVLSIDHGQLITILSSVLDSFEVARLWTERPARHVPDGVRTEVVDQTPIRRFFG